MIKEPAMSKQDKVTIHKLLQKKSGYTLIDILVSLGILTLLFSVGYAGYREYARRQALTAAVRIIKGDLRYTQELALAGKKPVSCTVLDGYQFVLVSGNSYEVRATCAGTTYLDKSVSLSSNFVTLSNLTPNLTPSNTIIFKSLGQGNNIPSGTSTAITVSQIGTTNTAVVNISSGGEIW